jgi:DNA-binding FrmR family transcriptional regulator
MPKKKHKECCDADKKHPDYRKEFSRLNRISGQVEGVKRMIESRRYCPEILTQLRAVRAAIHAVEARILESHLDACVNDAFVSGSKAEREKKIAELKTLYRKYND